MQFTSDHEKDEVQMVTSEKQVDKPMTPDERDAYERKIFDDMMDGKFGPHESAPPAAPATGTVSRPVPSGGG
jgi:hypothetical protein